jgi:hypothetical protein
LRLYGYFLSRQTGEGAVNAAPGDWKIIEDKLREALRLRHKEIKGSGQHILQGRVDNG